MNQLNNNINEDWFGLLLSNKNTPNSLRDYIKNNIVSKDSLFRWFEQIQGTKVFILDACFSGGFINNSVIIDNTPDNIIEPDSIEKRTKAELLQKCISNYINAITANNKIHNGIILSSSGSREVSWDGFFGNSVFTYFLKNGVGHCDYNNDGLETVLEMYIYVKEGVKKYWNMQEADSTWNFMPHISAHPADVALFDYRDKISKNNGNGFVEY